MQDIGTSELPSENHGVLKFENDNQKKVHEALMALDSKHGKEIADIYAGVLLANANKQNPERTHQVAHSVRELTTILPLYFTGSISGGVKTPRYDDVLSKKTWDGFRAWFSARPIGDPTEEMTSFIDQITLIVENQNKLAEKLSVILESHEGRSGLPKYHKDGFIHVWINNHKWFVSHSHHDELKNNRNRKNVEKEFDAQLNIYHDLLYQLLVKPPFFEGLNEINELCGIPNPTGQDVNRLTLLISHPQQNNHFYRSCNNPAWLTPLAARGAFRDPAKVIIENNFVSFTSWPESKFLARMAKLEPEKVFNIIKDIRSENQSVLLDFVDAALASPPKIACRYVKLIQKYHWIDASYNLLLPSRISDLMEMLSNAGMKPKALQLARRLLKINPGNSDSATSSSIDQFRNRPHHPRFDEYEYIEILRKKSKSLSSSNPLDFFEILRKNLFRSIPDGEHYCEEGKAVFDVSYIWRPQIHQAKHKDEDAKNALLDEMVEMIRTYHDNDSLMEEIGNQLQGEYLGIFFRLKLFLYRQRPDLFHNEIERALLDSDNLHKGWLKREYIPLLAECFSKLSDDGQKSILSAIDCAAHLVKEEDESGENFEARVKSWRQELLLPIKPFLPAHYLERYKELLASSWSEDQLFESIEMTSYFADQSPINQEDIEKMPPEVAFEYLKSYKPQDDFFSRFSANGLASAFQSAVANNPQRYAPFSSFLIEYALRPLYIYHFIQGMKEAVKSDRVFDWKFVLPMLSDVVQKVDTEGDVNRFEQDWKSARKAIADLLGEALGKNDMVIPIDLRASVWSILEKLVDDEEPSAVFESESSGMDPITASINTVRGEAMHAVVNYGLWTAKYSSQANRSKMPEELRAILDSHLDTDKDPALAIRSVYGWRLPNISYLDHEWVKGNFDRIFPESLEERPLFVAALQGFLANRVFQNLSDLFHKKYKLAIDILGTSISEKYTAADIDKRLPEHLMIVYANSSDFAGVIDYFFRSAPLEAKSHAIGFVGRQIVHEIKHLENRSDIYRKLQNLWEGRLKNADSNTDIEELKEFGWWFKAGSFDEKLAIQFLYETLARTRGKIDVFYRVIEELEQFAKNFPEETALVLELLIDGEPKQHEIEYKLETIRKILRVIKDSDSQSAKLKVIDIANKLGERGFTDFGDLAS